MQPIFIATRIHEKGKLREMKRSRKCLLLPTQTIARGLDNRLLHNYQQPVCYKILIIITNQKSTNNKKSWSHLKIECDAREP